MDELVMPLFLIGSTAALFTIGFIAARFAGWYGIAAPAAVCVLLGFGWEWQAEAAALIVVAAVVLLVGFAVGLARRRREKRSAATAA